MKHEAWSKNCNYVINSLRSHNENLGYIRGRFGPELIVQSVSRMSMSAQPFIPPFLREDTVNLPHWEQQRRASYIFGRLVYDELWPTIQQYVQTKCYGCRLQRLLVIRDHDLDDGLHTCSTPSGYFWLECYTERFWEHLAWRPSCGSS